jgi:hypothetical protein
VTGRGEFGSPGGDGAYAVVVRGDRGRDWRPSGAGRLRRLITLMAIRRRDASVSSTTAAILNGQCTHPGRIADREDGEYFTAQ